MNRRSLTLLEMLVALALLAALGALIVPAIMDSLRERAFEGAADVTGEQLVMARAHAQATGEPVEVTYRAGTKKSAAGEGTSNGQSRVEARFFDFALLGFEREQRWDESVQSGKENAQQNVTESSKFTGEEGDGSPESGNLDIPEAWASRDVAEGVWFMDHQPQSAAAAQESLNEGASEDEQSSSEDWLEQDIRLAVFMPDGSALPGEPVYISDDDGRVGRLTINPWNGMPVFERLPDADESVEPADEEPVDQRLLDMDDELEHDAEGLEEKNPKRGRGD